MLNLFIVMLFLLVSDVFTSSVVPPAGHSTEMSVFTKRFPLSHPWTQHRLQSVKLSGETPVVDGVFFLGGGL